MKKPMTERVCFILKTEEKHMLMVMSAKKGESVSVFLRSLLKPLFEKERKL